MECPRCHGHDLRKAGFKLAAQRYCCRTCGRWCTDRAPKFGAETKAHAIDMYLNNVGIRKIARFVGASPAGVLRWIRKEHDTIQARLAAAKPAADNPPDIIEMDEIYTFVQKTAARGNLDGVYRRSKRFSKTQHMLDIPLNLFFNRHLIGSPT